MKNPNNWGDIDWHLVILVVGFVLALPIYGGMTSPLEWLSDRSDHTLLREYETSVREAAVTTPDDRVGLVTFGDLSAKETFVTLKRRPWSLPAKASNVIWLALPNQLQGICEGSPEPLKVIQQALGLPTVDGDYALFELSVPLYKVRRPCVGASSLREPYCSTELPAEPALVSAPPASSPQENEIQELKTAYRELRFIANQMWTSWRIGFRRTGTKPGEDTFSGYPFTGMGWTYNWNSDAKSHVGVSEFILNDFADVNVSSHKTPEDFCRSVQRNRK
jgi:hypothetical protein